MELTYSSHDVNKKKVLLTQVERSKNGGDRRRFACIDNYKRFGFPQDCSSTDWLLCCLFEARKAKPQLLEQAKVADSVANESEVGPRMRRYYK